MPKSRKKKNQDFQKVKLKVGKEKRQGNETLTSFKTRTIKVTQSLRDSSSTSQQPQTKKKLTFEELLRQCDANKTRSQRLSALEGLRELALSADIPASFWAGHQTQSLMTKVAGLFSDPEPVVRQAVLQLCKAVFPLLTEQTLPLKLFSAQLCCAMSHISDEVRRDALVLFDMVFEKCPEKLIDENFNLVPALINQISTYMVGAISCQNRMDFNPRSKLSSQKWRKEVLQRLTKIVDISVKQYRKDTMPCPLTEDEVFLVHGENHDYPEKREALITPGQRNLWTTWPKARPCHPHEYSNLARDPKQLQEFICSVLPVVKQCWTEEFASEHTAGTFHSAADSGDRPLTQESLPTLQTVVSLLYSFVECWRCTYDYNRECSGNCWFRSSFLNDLKEMLLPHFPIILTEVRGRKGQKTMVDQGQSSGQSALQDSALQLNLSMCEMLASFPPPDLEGLPAQSDDVSWQKKIVSFLLTNFKQCRAGNSCKRLTSVLRQVFFHFSGKQVKLLAKIQKRFLKASPLSKEKLTLVGLLDDLAFSCHSNSVLFHPCCRHNLPGSEQMLEVYLQALPKLLVDLCGMQNTEAREKMALRITQAMCRMDSKDNNALLDCMLQILDAEKGAFAKLPASCHENVLQAVTQAYHHIPVPELILEQLELILCDPRVDRTIASRLFTSVNMRFDELLNAADEADLPSKQELEDCRKRYISFVFSCLVGHKTVELKALHEASTPQTGGLTCIVWTSADVQQFKKHAIVTDRAGRYFNSFIKRKPWNPDLMPAPIHSVQTMDVMAEIWNLKILKKYRALSVLTVRGALTHWLFMMKAVEGMEVLHVDKDSYDPGIHLPADWPQRLVNQMLPVFKSHVRPFTKLTFSLLYSLIKMERGEEEGDLPPEVVEMEEEVGDLPPEVMEVEDKVGDLPPEEMRKEMWGIAVSVLETSFRMVIDLVQVMTDFVQEVQSDLESERMLQLLIRLMNMGTLQFLVMRYRHVLAPQLGTFAAAVKSATPQVEETKRGKSLLQEVKMYM